MSCFDNNLGIHLENNILEFGNIKDDWESAVWILSTKNDKDIINTENNEYSEEYRKEYNEDNKDNKDNSELYIHNKWKKNNYLSIFLQNNDLTVKKI